MKLSEKLYEDVADIWKGYHIHPFIQGLGNGTLDEDSFRHYMIQDYLYLLDYSKVFALGVVKSREEELMRRFAAMVAGTLQGEMSIHKSYMKRLGITDEDIQNTKISFANQSYTAYMLDRANRGDALEILVTVLACAWSYAEIGERLGKIPNAKEHPLFGEWIQGYSSKEYQDDTKEMIDLVDKMGKDISPEKENYVKDIFIQCSHYEYDFWEMAYRKE